MADESRYTADAIEADKERTLHRCITTGVIVALVCVFGSITFGCSQNYHNEAAQAVIDADKNARNDAAELQQKVECVKAGGSWMPVQAIQSHLYDNGGNYNYRTYEMSCVNQTALQAVTAQNAKIIEAMPKG